jgi:GH24 family phage-related lysozyme (muramidase)
VWPSVQAAFHGFTVALEAELPYLYLDILGYVTTGDGNLADPVSVALAMPWKNADGSAASAAQITAAWNAVDAERSDPKGQRQSSGLATHYGQAFEGVTTIRLTQSDLADLFQGQLASDEASLRHYFPGWDSLPADGQMGILSMSWAMGTGHFGTDFGTFTAAVNAGDWATADAHSAFRGAGVARRIAANHVMFQNAAQVVQQGLDPAVLYYPTRLAAPAVASSFWPILGGLVGLAAGVAATVWRR